MPEPFVDAEDIADVAVAALTEDGHADRLYELTGPRLLTFAEAVEEIAGRPAGSIRYEQISMEQFTRRWRSRRCRPTSSGCSRYLFSEVLDGRNAKLADGVQRALGREPRDFADFARDAAAGAGRLGMSSGVLVITLVAALGCGLAAGFFFAFSTCVMPALRPPPGASGRRGDADDQRRRSSTRCS